MIPYCILIIENDDDREFMTSLYLDYRRLMYSEINKVVKSSYDADDIMQSVLEKLIDKIPLLRSRSRDQRVNYIISTCKFTAYNFVSRGAAKKEVPLEDYTELPDTDQSGHEIELRLIKGEELDALRQVLSRLDTRTRCLLEGYYFLEKPMAELGKELGIKPDSVRMALARARRKAFELLRDDT